MSNPQKDVKLALLKDESENQKSMTASMKSRILVVCLSALIIGNMMVENIVIVLPDFIKKQDWTGEVKGGECALNENDISYIISIFSIARIMFIPFNGAIKQKLGSKNTMVLGLCIVTLSLFGLGAISAIHDPYLFLVAACILRFFQGFGDVLLQITGFCIITSIFHDELTKYISMLEIFSGIGMSVGPVLATVIFKSIHYKYTLFVFAAICVLESMFCAWMLPSELNQSMVQEDAPSHLSISEGEVNSNNEEKDDDYYKPGLTGITWGHFFRNKSCVFTIVAYIVGTFNLMFWVAWLQNQFVKDGIQKEMFGYSFGGQSVTYLMMCLLYAKYEDKIPRKVAFIIGFVGMGISCLFVGPSTHFGINQVTSSASKLTALVMMGTWQTFFFIPVIPELLERLQVQLQIKEGSNPALEMNLNDKCNAAYGFMFSLVMFIGPLAGSRMYTSFGSSKTCDYVACLNFGCAVLFMVFNCGLHPFQDDDDLTMELEKLKVDDDLNVNQIMFSSKKFSAAFRQKTMSPAYSRDKKMGILAPNLFGSKNSNLNTSAAFKSSPNIDV